jgi:hypothetical protein
MRSSEDVLDCQEDNSGNHVPRWTMRWDQEIS